MKMFTIIYRFPQYLVISGIWLYQRTVSPDHGWLMQGRYPYGYCKHYPSCSEYTRQAVEKHGVIKGLYFGAIRIIKCNPFSAGGVDPVQ